MKPKQKQTVFSSMTQAAVWLKVDSYDLYYAKDHGCPGFRGGHVYSKEVMPWLRRFWKRREKNPEAYEDYYGD